MKTINRRQFCILLACTTAGLAAGGDGADRASAKPADAADPAPPTTAEVRYEAVKWNRPDEKHTFSATTRKDGATVFEITSPGGIDGITLKSSTGRWPKRILVRLRYTPERAFRMLEGHGAHLADPAGKPEDPRLEIETGRVQDGDAVMLELKAIPASDRMTRLYIWWIDAYRR